MLKDVVRGFGERVLTGVKKRAAKMAELAAKVAKPAAKRAKPVVKGAKPAARVAEFFRARRKLSLVCLSVGAVFLIFVSVFAFLGLRERSDLSRQNRLEPFSTRGIPPEELVLPSEPDFLPEVLLEREQRESWTAEDARPFWTDPLDAGPEEYSDLMKSVIDDLMERIP
jgi:hypothetical protein